MQKKWLRRSWFILPVLIALIILVVALRMKSGPEKVEATERAVKVRVIETPSIAIVSRAVGYGTTKAARTWEATAEAAGQVAWISEELKSGKLIEHGSLPLSPIKESNCNRTGYEVTDAHCPPYARRSHVQYEYQKNE